MFINIDYRLINDLKHNELKLYLTLRLMVTQPSGMELSYEEIGACSGLHRKTVQMLVPRLEEKGYISKYWPGGSVPPTYKILK
jgi:DNA-binding MarR family transcriptional regulator